MPKYRVMVEARFDIEAESEEAANDAAVKLVGIDHCIAWEAEDEADRRGTAAGY
jgi:hypothetical protein